MNNKPFFSVVLPTLNRAQYIPFAIQSVLNQTFKDFELIVSDNSSVDNTAQTVKNFSDSRIRYVKTKKVLPMYASWEFALEHAKGEYVTFLGDDDAHSSIYLESLKNVIDERGAQIVSCRMADYYYKNESLTTTAFDNELREYDSRKAIEDIFVYHGLAKGVPSPHSISPQLINAAYHASIFSKLKNKLGRVFPLILSADFYLAVMTLSLAGKYCYLDSPLSFHGVSPVSTTSSISSQEKGGNLKETQNELARLNEVPVKVFVPYNFAADALLLAKSHLGDALDYFDVDLTEYFAHIHHHIHLLELDGKDVSEERRQFAAALGDQEAATQKRVETIISSKKTALKDVLRAKFHKNPLYLSVKKLHNLVSYDKAVTVEGKKSGFSDITECARLVDRDFLKKYQSRKN